MGLPRASTPVAGTQTVVEGTVGAVGDGAVGVGVLPPPEVGPTPPRPPTTGELLLESGDELLLLTGPGTTTGVGEFDGGGDGWLPVSFGVVAVLLALGTV
jgi:hypothetical protein